MNNEFLNKSFVENNDWNNSDMNSIHINHKYSTYCSLTLKTLNCLKTFSLFLYSILFFIFLKTQKHYFDSKSTL